ncbi:hypothetical protein SE957_11695 [Escherichia coli]|nr:hypothetical protein EC3431_3464 [Escherichia coli 3431]MDW9214906.1 hypothetical protein [Escherichia coli]
MGRRLLMQSRRLWRLLPLLLEQWLWSLGQWDMTFSLMMGVPGRL